MTTDPDQSDRLVALRSNRPSQPFPHAQLTKIVTAGVSLSAVFGIIAYLGASASREAEAAARDLERVAATEAAATALYRPVPTVAPTVVTAPAPTTLPAGTAPSQPQVVQVPVATPAPAPVPAPRPSSNQGGQPAPAPANTTKTSG
jgi:hypothetical protein